MLVELAGAPATTQSSALDVIVEASREKRLGTGLNLGRGPGLLDDGPGAFGLAKKKAAPGGGLTSRERAAYLREEYQRVWDCMQVGTLVQQGLAGNRTPRHKKGFCCIRCLGYVTALVSLCMRRRRCSYSSPISCRCVVYYLAMYSLQCICKLCPRCTCLGSWFHNTTFHVAFSLSIDARTPAQVATRVPYQAPARKPGHGAGPGGAEAGESGAGGGGAAGIGASVPVIGGVLSALSGAVLNPVHFLEQLATLAEKTADLAESALGGGPAPSAGGVSIQPACNHCMLCDYGTLVSGSCLDRVVLVQGYGLLGNSDLLQAEARPSISRPAFLLLSGGDVSWAASWLSGSM